MDVVLPANRLRGNRFVMRARSADSGPERGWVCSVRWVTTRAIPASRYTLLVNYDEQIITLFKEAPCGHGPSRTRVSLCVCVLLLAAQHGCTVFSRSVQSHLRGKWCVDSQSRGRRYAQAFLRSVASLINGPRPVTSTIRLLGSHVRHLSPDALAFCRTHVCMSLCRNLDVGRAPRMMAHRPVSEGTVGCNPQVRPLRVAPNGTGSRRAGLQGRRRMELCAFHHIVVCFSPTSLLA